MRMKITFITSGFGLSGGTKAIFEFSNHLVKRGHQVFIVCSLTPFIFEGKWFNPGNFLTKILRLVKKSKGCGRKIDWFDLDPRVKLLAVPSLAEKHILDADIILATWWETAYFVKRYSAKKGKKFYLVQDYEIWCGGKEKVDKSYNLGLKNIVNSTWLKNKLEKIGAEVETVILHAPDHQQFYPKKIEKKGKKTCPECIEGIRILIPYRKEERKGTKIGLEAFKIVKEKHPEVELIMFGQEPIGDKIDGLEIEYHLSPVKDDLRKLYNSCNIFCYPALEEGFGMPPMEAMACKIPVVIYNIGAVPEYTITGQTALICRAGDVEKMAENIIELIENEAKRKEIAERGRQHIQQFTWAKATEQLENIFKKYVV